MANCRLENLDEMVVQRFGALAREAAGGRARVNARGEKQFIGVNVTDATEKGLIQEKRLDGPTAAFQARIEFFEIDRKGVRADALDCVG